MRLTGKKYVKGEDIDHTPYNIKEFELHQLKKDTLGILNGIIDIHIKAIKRRKQSVNNRKLNMTRRDFRTYSPLKNLRRGISRLDGNKKQLLHKVDDRYFLNRQTKSPTTTNVAMSLNNMYAMMGQKGKSISFNMRSFQMSPRRHQSDEVWHSTISKEQNSNNLNILSLMRKTQLIKNKQEKQKIEIPSIVNQ